MIKKIIILVYFLVFFLLNIVLIKFINISYLNKNNLSIKLNLIKEEVKITKEILDGKKQHKLVLDESLDNKQYLTLKEENNDLEKEHFDLENRIIKLEKIKLNQEKELESLQNEYNNLEKKTRYLIEGFPTYNQFPNYPNGCESVALYLMLKFHKVNVSVEQIVEKLKKGDAPFRKNGVLYGGDPEVEFVGDPRLKSGYGVYEKPILNVANQFKSGMNNITGSSLEEVLKIVKRGLPVQVWASINLKNTYICAKWQSTSTDRIVEWKCGLHSLVVIGFTYDKIITSDPYTGKVEYYSKTQFEKMYNTYGKRAIYYE